MAQDDVRTIAEPVLGQGESTSLRLRSEKIVETLELLHLRIGERFGGRGLTGVCAKLVVTARVTAERVEVASRPNLPVRVGVVLVAVAVAALTIFAGWNIAPAVIDALFEDAGDSISRDVAQALESAVNLIILAGLAVWFLVQSEARLKRSRALGHLHELRSFAHVVDMHQLTKDPVSILHPEARTPSSPPRDMSEFELARYLDYCAEMLSLIGKLAALYGERTRDTQVISAANDIENLTSSLGRKIWQKIIVIGEDGVARAA